MDVRDLAMFKMLCLFVDAFVLIVFNLSLKVHCQQSGITPYLHVSQFVLYWISKIKMSWNAIIEAYYVIPCLVPASLAIWCLCSPGVFRVSSYLAFLCHRQIIKFIPHKLASTWTYILKCYKSFYSPTVQLIVCGNASLWQTGLAVYTLCLFANYETISCMCGRLNFSNGVNLIFMCLCRVVAHLVVKL